MGLTTVPTSFIDAYETTVTSPVCGVSSISQTWQPLGHDGPLTELVDSIWMRAPS